MTEEKVQQKNDNVYRQIRNWIDDNQTTTFMWLFGVPIIFTFFYPLLSGRVEGTGFILFSFTLVFVFAAMVLSLNLEVGYLGIPNFGKVAFIAVGAYSYAITLDRLNGKFKEGEIVLGFVKYTHAYLIIFGLLMAVIITAIFGVLLTLPTLRLREDYLAIVTIVAGEIVRVVAFNEEIFGGFGGFTVDNPVNEQFDTSVFISGFYLSRNLLFLVLAFYASTAGLYFYLTKSLAEDETTLHNIKLQRLITVVTLGAIVIILLDFFQALDPEPSIGLHLAILSFVVGLVFYRSHFQKWMRGYEFFSIFSGIAVINYIAGQSLVDTKNGYQILGLTFQDNTELKVTEWFILLYTMLALLIVYVIMEEIYNSPFGRTLRAIREDDTSAISVGKSVFGYRLRALVIASALAGFMGAIFAQIITIVNPLQFQPLLTFILYIMLIIGGTGNNRGAIFGALMIQLLFQITRGTLFQDSEWFYPNPIKMITNIFEGKFGYIDSSRALGPENIGNIFVGVMLIVFMIYAPAGIIPEVKKNNQKYYDLAEYYQDKDMEGDRLFELIKSITNTDLDTEDWISNE